MKKLVSTLLALSIILGTLFTGMSFAVSAAKAEPVIPEEIVGEAQHYPIAMYDAVSNYKGYGNNLSKYDKASIVKEGVDGSYALKIEGEGKDVETYIMIGTGAESLTPDVEYTLEMKIKRDINFDYEETAFLDFGISTAWTNQMEWAIFTETDVFETFTGTFTPVLNESGKTGWCHIVLEYNIPVGGAIYIDDIKLYTADATDVNLYDQKNETKGSNLGSFDWTTTTAVVDNTIAGSVYDVNPLTDYSITAAYVSIAENNGVDGSAAMKIGPTSGKKNFFWQFAVEGTKYGGDTGDSFYMGKTVRVAFTAKKVGTVSDFSLKFYKSGSWKQHVMLATELTDDWVRYETDITFTSYDMYVHSTNEDGTVIYRGGHNRLLFESNVAADSCVYIDNIEVYAEADDFTENGCTLGTFDTFLYAKNTVDNTALEGVTYEPYDKAVYYQDGDWSNTWAEDLIPADEEVVISESGEGVKGSYALKVVGTGNERQFALDMGNSALNPDTQYMLRFKAKTSSAAALTKFDIGISSRWKWQGSVPLGMSLANESGITEIGTDWNEYTTFVTTDESGSGSYRYTYFNYNLADGAILYVDDIEIYEVDGDGINYFPQGTFGRVSGVSAIDAGDEEGYFDAKYVNDYTTDKTGFAAAPLATSLAVNGKHALAIGFNDDYAVNGRVWFELTGIDTGKTYKVKFSTLLVGEVTKLSVNMKDGMAADIGDTKNSVELLHRASDLDAGTGGDRQLVFGSELWQTYEFYFTDEYIEGNDFTWPGMAIYVQAAAGAGVLIDDVSVCEVSDTMENIPNLFKCAGFEKKEISAADFSSNKFWGTDVFDLSFMNNLPKSVGFYNLSYNSDSTIYEDVLSEDSDFAYANTAIIDSSNLNLVEFEAQYAFDAGKEIWLAIDDVISVKDSETEENYIVADYQSKIVDAANLVQNIAGDAFQGFYFDEPHLHFESNEKFIEVTKYLRETYKKRVFAMTKHDSFNGTTANVIVTEDSFKYVTDIGYWNYSINGIQPRIDGFNNNALTVVNENARAWIAPLMGENYTYDSEGNLVEAIDTEEEAMQIFNAMLAGIKSNDNFGGIMLYSLTSTNGYEHHKLDENGVADYNNYRNLLLAVADEFGGNGILADELNEDGVLVVDGTVTLGDYDIDVYVDNSTVTVTDNGEDIGVDAVLNKTGITVNVTSLTSCDVKEIKVAFVNDVNGDGVTNLRDLVRMKKLASDLDAPAEQLAAAGSTKATGIQATHLTAFRGVLLGK